MKAARQLTICILLLTGIMALYGGIHMILDPTGDTLGLPFYLLTGSVFSDYELAGWILSVTVGIFSLAIALCIVRRNPYVPFFVILQGVIICLFIIVLMVLFGEGFIIEYAFLVLGAALIVLGILLNQKRIARENKF